MKRIPIVILPGWKLEGKKYFALKEGLQQLGYSCFLIDFPGFGNKIPLSKALKLSDYVLYLKKYLIDHKLEKATFICHSFGGRVAIKYSSQFPAKVNALILTGVPGFPSASNLKIFILLIISKLGKILFSFPPFSFFTHIARKILYRSGGSSDYLFTNGYLRETFKNVIREELKSSMNSITTPTLLLWGKEDHIVPPNVAIKMKKNISESTLIIEEEANHKFPYQFPEVFSGYVDQFLKKYNN